MKLRKLPIRIERRVFDREARELRALPNESGDVWGASFLIYINSVGFACTAEQKADQSDSDARANHDQRLVFPDEVLGET